MSSLRFLYPAAAAGMCAWTTGRAKASGARRQRVVVLGGGVMGSAAAWKLAAAGCDVTLIDENHPVRGSWGESRASHLSMEDPFLLRLSLHSIRQWKQLNEAAEEPLMRRAGRLWSGPLGSQAPIVEAIDAELAGQPEAEHEQLSADETNARFPAVHLEPREESALYMPEGYILLVQQCLPALQAAAAAAGATILSDERVCAIDRTAQSVMTDGGATFEYDSLVVATGPWTNAVLRSAALRLLAVVVSNEQTVNFGARSGWREIYSASAMPLFTYSNCGYKGRADGMPRYFYCVPLVGADGSVGMKIGFHRQGAIMHTDDFVLSSTGRTAVSNLPHHHNYIGHNCIGHKYIGHKYIGIESATPPKERRVDPESRSRCIRPCTEAGVRTAHAARARPREQRRVHALPVPEHA